MRLIPFCCCLAAAVLLSACREEGADDTDYPEFGPGFEERAGRECVDSGGRWVRRGEGVLWACVRQTRDSGKVCTEADDCESVCLARSRTCAPVLPLFGCHEVLGTGGERSTLCTD